MDYIYQTPIQKRSTAAELRHRAWEALRGKWLIAIGIGLIVSALSSGTVSGISSGTFSFSMNLSNPETTTELSAEQLGILMIVAFAVGFFAFGLALVQGIFLGGPVSVGYAKWNLNLIDGTGPLHPLPLFNGFRFCYWKAVKVRTIVTLLQLAVMLPFLLPFGFYMFACYRCIGDATQEAFMVLLLAALLMLCGLAVYILLEVVVLYRYSLCNFILAEYPELEAGDVLRNSASLMKGNVWRLICLSFSFIGWILLAIVGSLGIGLIIVAPYQQAALAEFYNEVSGRAMAKEVEFPSIDPEDYYQI